MLIKNEIELHSNSVQHMKETFAMYERSEDLDQVLENPIIHIYPKEDTYDSDGELNGFIDAIQFVVDIYDTNNKKVKKGTRLHDAIIPQTDWKVSQLKIFKDLSTMIVLIGKYEFAFFQALEINRVN